MWPTPSHYGELAEALAAVISGEPVNLLETLAGAPQPTSAWPTPRVAAATVTVHKPQAPIPLNFRSMFRREPVRLAALERSVAERSQWPSRDARDAAPIWAIGWRTLRGSARWIGCGRAFDAVSPVYETPPWGPVPPGGLPQRGPPRVGRGRRPAGLARASPRRRERRRPGP